MRFWAALVFGLLFFSCDHPESQKFERYSNQESNTQLNETNDASETEYKVIGIKDGDTFVILMGGKEQTVRFAHIDCPEKRQPFGNKAKQFVSDMCFGSYVQLTINDKNKFDRSKRLIAEIVLNDGRNLNKELIRNGLAWHFKKYSDNGDYADLENEARQNKVGIWSEPNPVAPWEWRKSKNK